MSTTTVGVHREQMIRWLESGRSYEFLTMAAPYLDVCPDDHYVRLMAVREYLKLGLIVPAKELVESPAPASDFPAEFASVRESLRTVTAAPTPWAQHAKRFEDNLIALSGRGVETAPIREAWALRQDDYQLFRDKRGLEQVRTREGSGRWRWFPRLGDHRAVDAARALPEDSATNTPGPYLFEGLDLGWYFQRVYDATRDTFLGYSCALFVIEPDPAAIALLLHLHDWSHILSDPRVFWFVGDSCTDRLWKAWDDDLDLPWPKQAFRLGDFGREGSPSAVKVVEETGEAREAAIRKSLEELERRYASRNVAYWAKRLDESLSGRGAPLRILTAVSTHTTFLQYSIRDARRAFESLGHKCVVLTERAPYHIISPLTYHNAIRELDPDLFFNIDHLRHEFASIIPTNLPVLTWDQDQLPQVFTKKNVARIGPLDFVAACSKSRCLMLGGDPRQFLQTHIPTCPEQFSGDPLTDEECRRYTCDVSYVSHASQTPKAFHEHERAVCKDDRIRALLDAIYELTPPLLEKYRVMRGALPGIIIEEASRRSGVAVRDEESRNWLTGWYLWRLGDRIFRHEGLEWVAQWARRNGRKLRIYGNGWDTHPTLSEFAAGPAENGRELLCIYRASKINLQLMPAGFIHQRALDGLASGGFFLSRRTPNDLRGKTLRALANRIETLGISSTSELLDTTDDKVQSLLNAYIGEWLDRVDRRSDRLLDDIRISAEVLHPEEVFPRFQEILFDSATEFSRAADHFLADESERRSLTDEMRRIVIDHFSYPPTMDLFLRAMCDYFQQARH